MVPAMDLSGLFCPDACAASDFAAPPFSFGRLGHSILDETTTNSAFFLIPEVYEVRILCSDGEPVWSPGIKILCEEKWAADGAYQVAYDRFVKGERFSEYKVPVDHFMDCIQAWVRKMDDRDEMPTERWMKTWSARMDKAIADNAERLRQTKTTAARVPRPREICVDIFRGRWSTEIHSGRHALYHLRPHQVDCGGAGLSRRLPRGASRAHPCGEGE